MGQLTASIAHEVNQPIAATVTNAQAALRWLSAEPPDSRRGAARARPHRQGRQSGAAMSIGRIRALIKKAPPRKDRLDINEAIREVIELTRGEAVKNACSVQTRPRGRLAAYRGDRVQLQQVILNLIINAVEAMSGISEGTRAVARSAPGEPSRRACSSRSGIRVRAWRPRRSNASSTPSTRRRPGGLGLGLSICRSIIEAHGGRLWASANVPRGAIFHFTVPAGPDSAS